MRQILIALVLFTTTTAHAETSFSVSAYVEGTVAFTSAGVQRLPLGLDLELGMTNVITPKVAWYTGLSVATPFLGFAPAPRLITGPSFTLSDHWCFSPVVMYQLSPPYDGAPTSHSVGGGVNLAVSITKEISLGLVVGVAVSLGTPTLDPSVTLAPNITWTLPGIGGAPPDALRAPSTLVDPT